MNFRFLFFTALVLGLSAPAQAAYDKDYIGKQITYSAKYEDTFVHLARDYNLGYVELRAANPNVDPWMPGEGTKIVFPLRHLLPDAPREGIVINLPEMRLYAYVNGRDGAPVSFPLGVGREGLETPLGTTKIIRKQYKPTWRPTQRMLDEDPELEAVVGPGIDNPLGTHALYLGWPQYAIHGTNRPFGIGRRVSSGCIRMYPEAIVQLYDMAEISMPVTVVDQPIKLGWIDNVLYIEAHPTLDQALSMEEKGIVEGAALSDEDRAMIEAFIGDEIPTDRLSWSKIEKILGTRAGLPVAIGKRIIPDIKMSKVTVVKTKDRAESKDENLVSKEEAPDAPIIPRAQGILND